MYSDSVIIIPAHNEAKSISRVVSAIRALHAETAVVVIDDGSSDDTAILARQAGATVLSHPFNLGYGVAIQTGYKYAVGNNYLYLVQLDGDGQHSPKNITDLLQEVHNDSADVILGSRFREANSYQMPWPRLVGIKLFRFIIRVFSGKKISDPTTGFQAMNRKVLNVLVQDVFPRDYPDADIVILLSKLRFRIKEMPVTMYPNIEKKSMHNDPFSVLYYIFKMFLSILVTQLRKY